MHSVTVAASKDLRRYLSCSLSLSLSLSLPVSRLVNSNVKLLISVPAVILFLLSACCLMSAYLYIEVDLIVGSLHLCFVLVVGPFGWVSCLVLELRSCVSSSFPFLFLPPFFI